MMVAEILPPEPADAPLKPWANGVVVEPPMIAVPHPCGAITVVEMRDGLHLAWARTCDDRALLCLFAGDRADIGFSVTCTVQGIDDLIGDLSSIREQLRAR